ncbi:MAG: acyl carrier protein [Hellea sp.]|nr:acyl carrier protein [Hellea sp.]
MDTALQDKIIRWIANSAGSNGPVGAHTNLVAKQTLDSLQIMDMVLYLEQDNNIKIPLDALTEENFRTPAAIAKMVTQVQAQG